jgi:hypothetical protein
MLPYATLLQTVYINSHSQQQPLEALRLNVIAVCWNDECFPYDLSEPMYCK